MYLATRYMEISMYLATRTSGKVHENFHVPCNETYGKVNGNFHVPCHKLCCTEVHGNFHVPCSLAMRLIARYMEISMYLMITHSKTYIRQFSCNTL